MVNQFPVLFVITGILFPIYAFCQFPETSKTFPDFREYTSSVYAGFSLFASSFFPSTCFDPEGGGTGPAFRQAEITPWKAPGGA